MNTAAPVALPPKVERICDCGATFESWGTRMCGACAAAEGQRERAAQVAARLSESSATLPRWSFASFDNPKFAELTRGAPAIVAAGKAWQSGSLIFSGPTGIGKTLTAVAIAHRVHAGPFEIEASRAVIQFAARLVFTTAHKIVEARKSQPLGRGRAPLIERATSASLLILDECGFEPSDEAIFPLIDERYAARAPTIVTTGLELAGLRSKYGDAWVRRLTDNGPFVTARGSK